MPQMCLIFFLETFAICLGFLTSYNLKNPKPEIRASQKYKFAKTKSGIQAVCLRAENLRSGKIRIKA